MNYQSLMRWAQTKRFKSMTWRDTSNEEGAVLSQILRRDDGRLLGMIIRYDEDAPTYALGRRRDPARLDA
jgi:hypothetical protein